MESPFSRFRDARYGYLTNYNLPLSKAVVASVAPKGSPPVFVQPTGASKLDRVVSVQTAAVSPPWPEGKFRSREQVSGGPARVAGKETRDESLSAWGAGVDGKGSLRDLRKKRF